MDQTEIISIIQNLRTREIKEYLVSKEDFLDFRKELVQQEDFKYFRGIARRGGASVYQYVSEPRS